MTPVNDPAFNAFRRELESYPRLCGYYIIELLSIAELKRLGLARERILEQVFEYFDDETWPPLAQCNTGRSWDSDYRIDAKQAQGQLIDVLTGGVHIGCRRPTIDAQQARNFFERFERFFAADSCYYSGMGLGNPEYALQHGLVAVDNARAGIVWVVEDA